MNTILKPVISVLLIMIAVSMLFLRTNTVTEKWSEGELDYALRTATQDATAVLIDNSHIFGMDEEAMDFTIDIEKATNQFRESFFKNIGSAINQEFINEMHVSLSGYVGYRYIYAQYPDGDTMLPFPYAHHHNDGKLYEFTLGEKIFVTDLNTGDETTILMTDLSEHFFSSDMTNEEFREMTIMSTINNFLSVSYSDKANTTAYNAGSGMEFNLGIVDYAANDPSVMTKLSAVIDGPGFFAVIDYMDTHVNQLSRIVSFGGAELVLREE